jgi:hypothetical protein
MRLQTLFQFQLQLHLQLLFHKTAPMPQTQHQHNQAQAQPTARRTISMDFFTPSPPDLRPIAATTTSTCGSISITTLPPVRTFPRSPMEGGTPPIWLLWLHRKSTRWRLSTQHDKPADNMTPIGRST